jgi:D-arginine dehydrogenase
MDSFDICIVGAGIAGASLAAAIGSRARVLLIEGEERPGYHTTGRSAATWHQSLGDSLVQPLTEASGAFLREHGFLSDRGALTIARKGEEARLYAFAETCSNSGMRMDLLDRAGLDARIPGLRPEWTLGALEIDCSDIDVAGLHQHFLGAARKAGVELWTRASLSAAIDEGDAWRCVLSDGRELRCEVLVNAAGAWADTVAEIAGVRPLCITPLRRTIAQLRVAPAAAADMPMVFDLDHTLYFKPESGSIWLSPQDETPTEPCDAAAEELDVAIAIDRLSGVVDWRVERVEHRWAGLRNFAPDRLPVYGFDRFHPRFFWCAGQGGFGIQTAPAAAQLAAALVLGDAWSEVDPAPYSPWRFA